eukprot:5777351-Pleurochrysis_carterae.AAC.1
MFTSRPRQAALRRARDASKALALVEGGREMEGGGVGRVDAFGKEAESACVGHGCGRWCITEHRRRWRAREERVEEERRTMQRSVESVVDCRVEPDGGTYGGVRGCAKNPGGSAHGVGNGAGVNLRWVRCEQGHVSHVDTHERRAVNPVTVQSG